MRFYVFTKFGSIIASGVFNIPVPRTTIYVGIIPPEKYIVNNISIIITFFPGRSFLVAQKAAETVSITLIKVPTTT